ncbi:MAG: Uma2 family endonuclease [Pseudomonadota bacterium]
MGDVLRSHSLFSVDEYLEIESRRGERHEFVDGVIYAMTGGTDRHNLLAGNAYFELRRQLRSPCQVFQQGMKLRIETKVDEARYYPDVFAGCDPDDRASLYREHPCVIIEVLSPSTESDDRRSKFYHYQTISTLQHYILVAQDVPQIEIFARSNAWSRETMSWGGSVDVCGGKATLTTEAIYDNIPFTGITQIA